MPRKKSWLLLAAIVGVTGCLRVSASEVSATLPLPLAPGLASRTPEYRGPAREGMLTHAQVDSLSSRIRALRAEPAQLSASEGDTVRISDVLQIIALDSAGVALGELPYYDFAFGGRGMRLLADGRFVFGRAGSVRFTASFPESLWRGKPADMPSITIPISVERPAR